jgi:tetratricopeptide (TPR) repeat protein
VNPLIIDIVSSSAEEWEKMGKLMFARENYQQAVVCFERAKKPLEASISNAYHLRKVARLLPEGSSSRKEGFNEAANAFYDCASGDHPQSRTCYLNAGKCYAEAGRDSEASKAYCCGGDFTKGAKHARMAGEFDRALQIIKGNAVDNTVATAIIEVCKVIYVREESYR